MNLKELSNRKLTLLRERVLKSMSIGIHDEDVFEAINKELKRREKNE
jgi:hypothetical protein